MSTPANETIKALCLACDDSKCNFRPQTFERRALGPHDVLIDMKYCGVCHSDLHVAAGHMDGVRPTNYPCVPGHELAGVAIAVGEKVTKVKVGQNVGVGCLVDSCQSCDMCKNGEEQKCRKGSCGTYNGKSTLHSHSAQPGLKHTLGGYTDKHVVDENFAVTIPEGYPLEAAGPVFCSGITMYDPLKTYGVKAGSKVGIAGLGGLGQMGVRLAKAMGAEVSVLTRSAGKAAFAKECGADNFIVYTDEAACKEQLNSLDLILNTIPAYHDYCGFNKFLNKTGKQVMLGLHVGSGAAMMAGKIVNSRVVMSMIGGIQNTQEVIDLCAEHKIYPKIEVVPVWEVSKLYTELDKNNDTGVRYVLDIAGTLKEGVEEKFEGVQAPELGEPAKPFTVLQVIRETMWFLATGKWL